MAKSASGIKLIPNQSTSPTDQMKLVDQNYNRYSGNEQLSRPSGQRPQFNQVQEPQNQSKRQHISPPSAQLMSNQQKQKILKGSRELSQQKKDSQKKPAIKKQHQILRPSSSVENKKKNNVTFAHMKKQSPAVSPEITENAENRHMIEEHKDDDQDSSQISSQPSLKSSSHSETYTTNKAEESLQKRKISGTQYRNRASELSRHFDQEEEKEVPNEHPSARKITPTRDGKNVTNRKGFSLDNMASGGSSHRNRHLNQKLSSGEKNLSSGLSNSGEKLNFLKQNDRQEMQSRRDVQFIAQQRKLVTEISDYEAQANKIHPGVQAKQISYQMIHGNPHQVRIQRDGGARMALHEQLGDNMSCISPENSFLQQSRQSRNVSQRRQQDNELSSRNSPRMTAKIGDRNRTSIWPPTPLQPQIIVDDRQFRNDNQMVIDQQFLYEQSLIYEQLQDSQKRSFATQPSQFMEEAKQSQQNDHLLSSIASCDLQASFMNNKGSMNENRQFQPHKMMQSQRKNNLQQQQKVIHHQSVQEPSHPVMSQDNTIIQEFTYGHESADDLLENSDFQDIEPTRLWKEIFYLRRQVAQKDNVIKQMGNKMQSMQSNLAQESRSNKVLKTQLRHLREDYFQSNNLLSQQNMVYEEESKEERKMNGLEINLPSEQSSQHAEPVVDQIQRQHIQSNGNQTNQVELEDFEEEKQGQLGDELEYIQSVTIQKRHPNSTSHRQTFPGQRDPVAIVTEAQQDDLPQTLQINASQFEGLERFQRMNYSSQVKDRNQLKNFIVSEEQSLQKQAVPEISNASSSKLNQKSPIKRPPAIQYPLEPVDENNSQDAQIQQDQPSYGQQDINESSSGGPQVQAIPQRVNHFNPVMQASSVQMAAFRQRSFTGNSQQDGQHQVENNRLENITEMYVPPNSTRVARPGNFLYRENREQPLSQRNHIRQYELEMNDSIHSLPNQGMNVHRMQRMQPPQNYVYMNQNYMNQMNPVLMQNAMPQEERKQAAPSIGSNNAAISSNANLLEHELDDNNHFTTNESILINKVNEMQTKTSRFGNNRNGRRWGFREPFTHDPEFQGQNLYMSLVMQQQQQQQQQNPQSMQQSMHSSGIEETFYVHQRPHSHQLVHFRPRLSFQHNVDVGLDYQEQELDEQVASGIRLMAGPRGGPARANSGRIQQSQVIRSIPQISSARAERQSNKQASQNNLLQQQRPCEHPPPRNIQGDVQSHVDGEELGALEGVGSGLVPQQRIPLPNQQQQPIPRHPSHESLVDPELSVYQNQSANRSQEGLRHQFVHSVDDAGMDEFDVADERAHLFGEQVNPDIMTYEQLLALQDRIGFVCKGMTVQQMDRFPMMKRSEYRKFVKRIAQPNPRSRQQQKSQKSNKSQRSHRLYQSCQSNLANLTVNSDGLMDYDEERKSQRNHIQAVRNQFDIADVEEEHKSMMDQESLKEKSMESDSNQSRPSSILENVKSNSLNGTNKMNGLNVGLNRNFEMQVQSSQNDSVQSPQSVQIVSPSQLSLSRSQSQQVRQQKFKVPSIKLTEGEEEGRSINNNVHYEEGKEDLEDAAPEEHHPKEEHLQQIGVSVPMPGHHVIQHAPSQSQSSHSHFVMQHIHPQLRSHQVQLPGPNTFVQQRRPQLQMQQQVQLHGQMQNQVQPLPQLSSQRAQNNREMPSSHYEVAQDELLPGEERKQPVRESNRLQPRGSQQIRQDQSEPLEEDYNAGSVDEDKNEIPHAGISENVDNNMVENRDEGSQEGSQEDVYDEGDDLLNSRLPIVMNINGSIPNQQPARVMGFQGEDIQEDLSRQHPVYASALQIQHNLAPRQNQRNQPHQVSGDQRESFYGDDEFGTSGNVYEEHKEDENGVQTPKYAQTKQNKTQQDGYPRKQFLFNDSQRVQQHQDSHVSEQFSEELEGSRPSDHLMNSQPQLSQSSNRSKAVSLNQSHISTLGQDLCIICQENYTAEDMIKVITPCNHYFHINCVNQWLLVEKKCPMCMNPLT